MSMNNNSYYVLKDYYWPLNTNKGNLLACSISKDNQMLQHYQLLVEILFLLLKVLGAFLLHTLYLFGALKKNLSKYFSFSSDQSILTYMRRSQ